MMIWSLREVFGGSIEHSISKAPCKAPGLVGASVDLNLRVLVMIT